MRLEVGVKHVISSPNLENILFVMSRFVMFMSKEIYSGLKINIIHVGTLQLYKNRNIFCLYVNELLMQ